MGADMALISLVDLNEGILTGKHRGCLMSIITTTARTVDASANHVHLTAGFQNFGPGKAGRSKMYLLSALLLFAMVATSGCATDIQFTVNTFEDLPDISPGDGVCAANDTGDLCSLRAAVEEANDTLNALRVLILVPNGTYELTQVGVSGLTLTRGKIIIRGAGSGQTVVDGLEQKRILTITGQDMDDIIVEGMTLRNGRVPATVRGGAVNIDSSGYLITFTGTRIENSVADFRGGGIYAEGSGVLNVINSVIADNKSSDVPDECNQGGGQSGGGGINVQGPSLNVIQSEIRDNCGSDGAGIRVSGGSNHLILRSTIAGNIGPNTGAGLYVVGANLRIEDSTISGNSITANDAITEGSGGGLHAIDSTVDIINTTIVENDNPFDLTDGAGGILADNSSVTMLNTVLADNHFSGQRECFGTITSSGGNFLSETDDDCEFNAHPSDILDGGDPDLGSLLFNGGLTRTMFPAASSPLINAGVDGCEPIDQRGLDFPAPKGGMCDIGAVER